MLPPSSQTEEEDEEHKSAWRKGGARGGGSGGWWEGVLWGNGGRRGRNYGPAILSLVLISILFHFVSIIKSTGSLSIFVNKIVNCIKGED